jgi:hypothetical protein
MIYWSAMLTTEFKLRTIAVACNPFVFTPRHALGQITIYFARIPSQSEGPQDPGSWSLRPMAQARWNWIGAERSEDRNLEPAIAPGSRKARGFHLSGPYARRKPARQSTPSGPARLCVDSEGGVSSKGILGSRRVLTDRARSLNRDYVGSFRATAKVADRP